jgi:Uma2 family endonuclease
VTTVAAEPEIESPSISDDASTLADLLERLGGISPARLWLHPAPGTATVEDVERFGAKYDRRFELIDGVLVEKPMGLKESLLGQWIATMLGVFVQAHRFGRVAGADGMMQLFPGLVRIPDAAFISTARLRSARQKDSVAPLLAPDLVVEVISLSNTEREMARKRREYLDAGVRLLWFIYPRRRLVEVFVPGSEPVILDETGVLQGDPALLPGFTLPVKDILTEWDEIQADLGSLP